MYHEAIDKACRLAHSVSYDRGMASVCEDVLRIALDGTLNTFERLVRVTGVLPFNPSPRLLMRESPSEEYRMLTENMDDEFRHGYIRGRYDCHELICRIDGSNAEERLCNIVAFCEVVCDIACVDTHKGGDRSE